MKKSTYFALIIASLLLISFSANPPQGNTGAPTDQTCNQSGCHAIGGSISGSVRLTGIPNEVVPGQTYPFQIELDVNSGNAARGGFQLVALGTDNTNSGTIKNPGSSSTLSSFQGRTYFEHQPAKNFNGSTELVYNAEWEAPEGNPGDKTTFYISSMLVNGNGSPTGDTYVSSQPSFTLANQMASLSANITDQSDALCNGDSNGSATVAASGGSENYTYNWDNGETTAAAHMLSAGTHNVTISDGENSVQVSVNIAEPEVLSVNIDVIITLECGDDEDGSLASVVNGGTSPYNYFWSNGTTTAQIDNLTPGQYNVTISDKNECSAVGNISLFAVDQTAPDIEVVTDLAVTLTEGITIFDINSLEGILLSSADNCSSELSIDWTPKSFGCDDIGSAVLNITATDQSGNVTSKTVNVTVSDEVAPSLTCLSDELRIGTCTNFTYTTPVALDNCDNIRLELISGIGVNGSFPIGETRDVYLATDASGNTASCEIVIINEPEIEVVVDVTDISCAGESDGTVSIIVSGTNMPFDISVEGIEELEGLDKGIYNYVVTDFTGCQITNSFDIAEPDSLRIIVGDVVRPVNSNSGDGIINISVTGGTPPYSFSWMTEDEFFSDEEDLSLLFPGEYVVEIEDSKGCTIRSEVFVLEEVTSINDPELISRISTYPNPSNDYLIIDINGVDFDYAQVELYSFNGELVLEERFKNSEYKVDLRNLTNGIYILKFRLDKDFVVRSLLIENGH